ncbi:MAG: sigma-70 family RNA polymerase sigma factor [Actinomycetota bacterium]
MRNPDGYLYRVGRNHALRNRADNSHLPIVDMPEPEWSAPQFEPELRAFMASLPEQQRVSVWLVHGLGYTLADAAGLLGCSRSTVAAHVRRALTTLRRRLEVTSES